MILSPAWSFCIDIGGRHAGKVSGTMNMAGNLGSAVVALAFPYLLEWTGSVETFFYVGAALNALGIVCWLAVSADRPISASA
jgi:ACS family glucarate transporter-like MFS transporter